MASPKAVLGPLKETKEEERDESAIKELIERVFTTRNLVHFAHWNTNSYAAHNALGDLYDGIVEETDNIVENYQGEFGLLSGLETECAKLDGDIIARIKADADWVKANRTVIACGSKSLENLVDSLTACYHKTIYKLQNLH